jgi:hypothetical protein
MEPQQREDIIKYFGSPDEPITLSETNKKIEKNKRTTKEMLQIYLTKFTARILLLFLFIPFILLPFDIISFDQLIDLITKIMAVLGPIVGAVWGYSFHSMQQAKAV